MEPKMLTPEEMAETQKSRTESDAELIKEGAEYVADEKGNVRLDVMENQKVEIKGAMEQELNTEAKKTLDYMAKLGKDITKQSVVVKAMIVEAEARGIEIDINKQIKELSPTKEMEVQLIHIRAYIGELQSKLYTQGLKITHEELSSRIDNIKEEEGVGTIESETELNEDEKIEKLKKQINVLTSVIDRNFDLLQERLTKEAQAVIREETSLDVFMSRNKDYWGPRTFEMLRTESEGAKELLYTEEEYYKEYGTKE